MRKKNYKIYIEDIIESIDKIERYINGLNFKNFAVNELIIDAVLRNIEIIGEASKNIPVEIREKHPDIPWRRMIGLRNIAIHEYFGVDINIIWKVITENLPDTKSKIVSLLNSIR